MISANSRQKIAMDRRGGFLWHQKKGLAVGMAGRTGRTRRPNGLQVPARRSMRLSDDALEVAEVASAALGITRDYYLDELLRQERARLDEDGRPKWWTKPLPKDQKELPLKSA